MAVLSDLKKVSLSKEPEAPELKPGTEITSSETEIEEEEATEVEEEEETGVEVEPANWPLPEAPDPGEEEEHDPENDDDGDDGVETCRGPKQPVMKLKIPDLSTLVN